MRRNGKTKQTRGVNQQLNDIERAVEKDDGARIHSRKHSRTNRKDKSHYRGTNDPSWYAISPQLLKDAGSISFNNALGIGLPDVMADTRGGSTNPYYIPGVYAQHYIPAIGPSLDNSSAINIAARRLYTFIRHANSGAANYDSPDLMLYILAAKSAYETYAQMVRAYGIANVYAQTNRYLPDAILTAAGFDPEDVRKNLANFRYNINILAAKINSLAIPKQFNLFKRAMWLTSNIFKDSSTIKSQAIVPRPMIWYVYNEGNDPSNPSVGYLEAKLAPKDLEQGAPISTWVTMLEQQLAALIQSEDIGIMAGDILKAYGNENLYGVSGISESYVVLPQYDIEYLLQLHNATNYGIDGLWIQSTSTSTGSNDFPHFNITQNVNTGAITFNPVFSCYDVASLNRTAEQVGFALSAIATANRIMDMRTDSPSPEDIFLASRFMASGATKIEIEEAAVPNHYTLNNFCTEIMFGLMAYRYQRSESDPGVVELKRTTVEGAIWENNVSFVGDQADVATKLDWAPYIFCMNMVGGGIGGSGILYALQNGIIGDFDNATAVDTYTLFKIHQAALLSMFDVPALNGFTTG